MSVNQRILDVLITYCVCDFLFHGYPCKPKEKNVTVGIPPTNDIPIYISCKFDMFIFEMVLVILKTLCYVSFCTDCPTMSFVSMHSDGIIAKTL